MDTPDLKHAKLVDDREPVLHAVQKARAMMWVLDQLAGPEARWETGNDLLHALSAGPYPAEQMRLWLQDIVVDGVNAIHDELEREYRDWHPYGIRGRA